MIANAGIVQYSDLVDSASLRIILSQPVLREVIFSFNGRLGQNYERQLEGRRVVLQVCSFADDPTRSRGTNYR